MLFVFAYFQLQLKHVLYKYPDIIMRWFTNTFHPSTVAPLSLNRNRRFNSGLHFRTHCGLPVKSLHIPLVETARRHDGTEAKEATDATEAK